MLCCVLFSCVALYCVVLYCVVLCCIFLSLYFYFSLRPKSLVSLIIFQVMLLAYEDLVDTVRPGDRVEVTGTLLFTQVQYSTVLYCTILYCTVLYCTVLYCTVL